MQINTSVCNPIPISQVEPLEKIFQKDRRLHIGAMSSGSVSQPAHEILAAAGNLTGVWQSSGEGGLDYRRRYKTPNGWNINPRIVQIASAR